ncbi:hypothetical protein [Aeromonas caviae]|uniref:hypothetical protein n=1 Tax=Aeromonas caviae TaxID=648 RepID=UPI000AAB2F9E|nr:hypothetical protein [Aeromonas caviae]MEE1912399.1 hypothetical protein [Aeromonas caviae]
MRPYPPFPYDEMNKIPNKIKSEMFERGNTFSYKNSKGEVVIASDFGDYVDIAITDGQGGTRVGRVIKTSILMADFISEAEKV